MKVQINYHLLETANAIKKIDPLLVKRAVNILLEAKELKSTVYLFGNGGSHANASHMANDLFKAGGIKAVCISEMVSTTLAYMNDISPVAMFSSILSKFLQKKDVVFAFSCSGNSKNVVNALQIAPKDVSTILLTGHKTGKATELANLVIPVNHTNIRVQESVHSAVCHAITEEIVSGM